MTTRELCCGGSGRSCGGALMRSTTTDDDAYLQRQVIADLHTLGWNRRGFTDPDTREPLTLRQVHDRMAVCIAVCKEFGV